jgi:hypothetical protein
VGHFEGERGNRPRLEASDGSNPGTAITRSLGDSKCALLLSADAAHPPSSLQMYCTWTNGPAAFPWTPRTASFVLSTTQVSTGIGIVSGCSARTLICAKVLYVDKRPCSVSLETSCSSELKIGTVSSSIASPSISKDARRFFSRRSAFRFKFFAILKVPSTL